MSLMQFYHTVRHLRPRQIVAQIRHRVVRRSIAADLSAGPYPGCVWEPKTDFLPPLQNNKSVDLLNGEMRFLEKTENVGWPPDWNRAALPKLWAYNLHYFDYLWSLDFENAITIARNWIDHHPHARENVGWEPYPTSLRLTNWCAIFFSKYRNQIERDSVAREILWASIWRQTRWLEENIETHLLGNHLLENALALIMAGSCFAGDDASRWFNLGFDLLRQQIPEQILTDGGHFERSPMYHSRAVYVLGTLKNINRNEVDELVTNPLSRAANALAIMTHPDGQIALLNDSAWDIYNPPESLTTRAPIGAFALSQTGYYGYRGDDGSYVICDAGPLGPDYQPGHAHGDMLAFELSLRGHRVIVDTGVFEYQAGSMRSYCRSTRAHNTIELDGQDQAEFWDVFRVAKRGKIREVNFAPCPEGFALSASHDGYRRLRGGPTHKRSFRWWNHGIFEITDTLRSSRSHRFVSRLHLHPDCSILDKTNELVRVRFAAGVFVVRFHGRGSLSIEDSYFCPRFGQKLDNKTIAFSGEFHREAQISLRIGLEEMSWAWRNGFNPSIGSATSLQDACASSAAMH